MSKIYGIGDEEELAEDLQREIPNRIIEELEKIKTEIKTQVNLDSPFISHGNVLGMEYAIALIDKHISKLKGENK